MTSATVSPAEITPPTLLRHRAARRSDSDCLRCRSRRRPEAACGTLPPRCVRPRASHCGRGCCRRRCPPPQRWIKAGRSAAFVGPVVFESPAAACAAVATAGPVAAAGGVTPKPQDGPASCHARSAGGYPPAGAPSGAPSQSPVRGCRRARLPSARAARGSARDSAMEGAAAALCQTG